MIVEGFFKCTVSISKYAPVICGCLTTSLLLRCVLVLLPPHTMAEHPKVDRGLSFGLSRGFGMRPPHFVIHFPDDSGCNFFFV